jgi:hypothetical protein
LSLCIEKVEVGRNSLIEDNTMKRSARSTIRSFGIDSGSTFRAPEIPVHVNKKKRAVPARDSNNPTIQVEVDEPANIDGISEEELEFTNPFEAFQNANEIVPDMDPMPRAANRAKKYPDIVQVV